MLYEKNYGMKFTGSYSFGGYTITPKKDFYVEVNEKSHICRIRNKETRIKAYGSGLQEALNSFAISLISCIYNDTWHCRVINEYFDVEKEEKDES